ncbi:unnamed protein product [Brassica oleracea]
MPHRMPAHKFLLPTADTCTCLMKRGVLDFIYWALLREMVFGPGTTTTCRKARNPSTAMKVTFDFSVSIRSDRRRR